MRHPPPLVYWIAFAAVTAGLALPSVRVLVDVPAGSAPKHRFISASAWPAVVYWFVGAGLLLAGRGGEPSPAARAWWAAGCGLLGLHVAVAFHAAHGWSHAAAVAATERDAGVGAGVYANYLFGLVWLADAAWLCAAPASYRRRPRWVGRAIYGFLAFVVFNAAVVFAGGAGRWLALAGFVWLAWGLRDGRRPQSGE